MPSISRRQFLGTTDATVAAAAQGRFVFAGETVTQPALEGLPTIPYGAVYFRKSTPPKEDWERDYKQAAADSMKCFRHWLLWSAIEVAPGKYDWGDYDRQLDLAAKYGIKTIADDENAFNVKVMGAKGDGVGDDAGAIQRAIEACRDAGADESCSRRDVIFPARCARVVASNLHLSAT